ADDRVYLYTSGLTIGMGQAVTFTRYAADDGGENGLRIEVDVRKDADAQLILNYLYKSTDLQIYYSYNNVAIIDRTPMVVGVLELLDTFINFRREVIVRRAVYEKDRKEKRCHILEGLMKAVSILDEIIYIIRHSKNKADSIQNLVKEFGFDEIQADAIVSMRLYNLTNTDIVKVREEFAQLVNEIEEMRMIIENRDIQHSVMIRELRAVKEEYDTPRRTRIEREVEEIVINKEQMIVNEHVVVAASRDGYIKRVSMRSFTASKDSETGTKKGDVIIGSIECDTLDTLLLFTSSGQYIYLPVWQIDEAKWKDTGMHLNKVVRITSEEKVIAAILVKNFNTYAWIVTVHDGGQIKRTPVSAWQVTKNNKTYPAMNVPSGKRMLAAFVVYESDSIALVSRNGFACRFPISDIPVTGTKSKGVKAMNLAAKDTLAGACVLKERDTGAIIMSQTGALKRIKADDIAAGARPIKGTVICRQIKSNPSVVTGILGCAPGDEIVFMDETRKVFRATDIPLRQREAGFCSTELTENALPLSGIEECRIIDIPEGADDTVHADVEKISLFEDENG
ncbi:MAG: DNA gyrase subunit A, partial [Solobacterium sp.]|nr:DNA gyrase subunit A [Solobacterium sp.]